MRDIGLLRPFFGNGFLGSEDVDVTILRLALSIGHPMPRETFECRPKAIVSAVEQICNRSSRHRNAGEPYAAGLRSQKGRGHRADQAFAVSLLNPSSDNSNPAAASADDNALNRPCEVIGSKTWRHRRRQSIRSRLPVTEYRPTHRRRGS